MTIFNPKYFFKLDNYKHCEIFEECNTVWQALDNISSYLAKFDYKKSDSLFEGAHLVNRDEISIGEGTVVEPGAYIKGPCVIGKNCTIRHGAYIRGGVITGDNCVIGHASELKNVIMLDNAKAAHFAYVGDSILGNDVNLGAGSKLANLKFNNTNVFIRWEGNVIDTGRRKFGAILGDGSQTGCNSVTSPGTVIGRRGVVYPNQTAKGVVLQDQSCKA